MHGRTASGRVRVIMGITSGRGIEIGEGGGVRLAHGDSPEFAQLAH